MRIWKILLPVIVPVMSFALSLDEIKSRLASQPHFDTLDIRVKTSVATGGFSSASETHLIMKGESKVWMELKLPTGGQRMVRNGDRYKVTDLKTGKSEYPKLAPEMLQSLPGQGVADFLSKGQYTNPKLLGNDLYSLDLVPGSDTTVTSRQIKFDAHIDQLVEIREVGKVNDTSITVIGYGGGNPMPLPKQLQITAKVNGGSTTVTLDFYGYVKPGNGDALFGVEQ